MFFIALGVEWEKLNSYFIYFIWILKFNKKKSIYLLD